MRKHQQGQTLMELMVVVAIAGLITTVAAGLIGYTARRTELRAATSEVRALLVYVRGVAIAHDRNVAVRFRPTAGGAWSWSLYEDGDGDGVRADDIARSVDRLIQPPRELFHRRAGIGIPPGSVPDPLSGGFLGLRLPIRFSSMMCSFSRAGEATNGSLVMTDGTDAVLIRVHGTSGRVSVMRWDGQLWRTGV